jgi:hypothetical protein
MALMVSPREIVYSAGAWGCAGLKAAGMAVETDEAGITAAVVVAACAFIAAASVAGIARTGCSAAAAGWASAKDDNTTAGSAAVVAASIGRLGLGGCFCERDIVMERILFSTAGARGGDAGDNPILLLLLLMLLQMWSMRISHGFRNSTTIAGMAARNNVRSVRRPGCAINASTRRQGAPRGNLDP